MSAGATLRRRPGTAAALRVVAPEPPAARPPHEVVPAADAARAFGELLLTVDPHGGLDALLRPSAARLRSLVGVERCSVYLREGHTGRFRGRLGHPHALDREIRRLTVGGSADAFTADVVRTRRPVAIQNVADDPRAAQSAIRSSRLRSVLGVPMVAEGEVLGVIFLDDGERLHRFDADQQEAAAVFAGLMASWMSRTLRLAKLPALRDELRREQGVAQRLGDLEERLAEVVRHDERDQALVDLLAETVRRPVLAVRGDLRTWSAADGATPPEVTAALAHVLSDEARRLPLGRAGVVEPDLDRGLRWRCLVAPLGAADADGWLAVFEHGARFVAVDRLLAGRIAVRMAERAHRERRVASAERGLREALLAHLVGRALPERQATALAARIGIGDGAPRLLAVVTARTEGSRPPVAALGLERWLRGRTASRAISCSALDDAIVVVADASSDEPGAAQAGALRTLLVDALDAHDVQGATVGVSSTWSGSSALGPAFEQAGAVARWAAATPAAGNVGGTVAELGAGRLLLTGIGGADQLAVDVLGPLLDDDAAMGDLLATLECFFAVGRNIRLAAGTLGVHENTVRHRFGRIRRLTGLDVAADADDQLTVHGALVALRLGHRAPRRPSTQAATTAAAAAS